MFWSSPMLDLYQGQLSPRPSVGPNVCKRYTIIGVPIHFLIKFTRFQICIKQPFRRFLFRAKKFKTRVNFSHHHLLKLKNARFNKEINFDHFTIDKSIFFFKLKFCFIKEWGKIKVFKLDELHLNFVIVADCEQIQCTSHDTINVLPVLVTC